MTASTFSVRFRRVAGLVRKETRQIVRDPSSYLVAVVLPLLQLFVFGYGVSLDLQHIPLGLVVEQATPEAESLVASFSNSRYFDVRLARHRREVEDDLVSGRLKGVVVLAADFTERLGRADPAPVQVIVDGSEPNTASLVQNYAQGVWSNWLAQEAVSRAGLAYRPGAMQTVGAEQRIWFNPDVNSHNFLVPGSIAIIMTMIGTLLSALVIAREWERGTMEALMTTPVTAGELLISKFIPYFLLGMVAMALAVTAAVLVFAVPLRGSLTALVIVSSAYLCTMLALGLLISTLTRDQFTASQIALIAGFLPAFELSGFVFEIDGMPAPIRALTCVLPPRYFVASLQTIFLAGDVPSVLVWNTLVLAGMAAVLFAILIRSTRMRLE
ncbi:MAG TPA: ABC transporter permease [Pirellulales bacterium]|jgi:ABC-2 type transport system permease protein|nr:ABC transporter permease [Pirellulales bacterium]